MRLGRSEYSMRLYRRVRSKMPREFNREQQRAEHFRILHLDGPVKKGAREIIDRALVLEGFEPRRKKRTGVGKAKKECQGEELPQQQHGG